MIPNNPLWRKAGIDSLIVPLIIILVGIAAFGLGRLSALQTQKAPLTINQTNEVATGTPVK